MWLVRRCQRQFPLFRQRVYSRVIAAQSTSLNAGLVEGPARTGVVKTEILNRKRAPED